MRTGGIDNDRAIPQQFNESRSHSLTRAEPSGALLPDWKPVRMILWQLDSLAPPTNIAYDNDIIDLKTKILVQHLFGDRGILFYSSIQCSAQHLVDGLRRQAIPWANASHVLREHYLSLLDIPHKVQRTPELRVAGLAGFSSVVNSS